MANKLKAITTRAKVLYKTGRYKVWTDAIKAASKQIGLQNKTVAKRKAPAKRKAAPKKVAIKKAAPKKTARKKAAPKRQTVTGAKVITGVLKKYTAVFFPVGFPVVSASVEAENSVMAKRLAKKWAVAKSIKLKPSGIKIWPAGVKPKNIS